MGSPIGLCPAGRRPICRHNVQGIVLLALNVMRKCEIFKIDYEIRAHVELKHIIRMDTLLECIPRDVANIVFEYLINTNDYSAFTEGDVKAMSSKIFRWGSCLLWAARTDNVKIFTFSRKNLKTEDPIFGRYAPLSLFLQVLLSEADKHKSVKVVGCFSIYERYSCFGYKDISHDYDLCRFAKNKSRSSNFDLISARMGNLRMFLETMSSFHGPYRWEKYMYCSVCRGHFEVFEFCTEKCRKVKWQRCMIYALKGRHLKIFEYCVMRARQESYEIDWHFCLDEAEKSRESQQFRFSRNHSYENTEGKVGHSTIIDYIRSQMRNVRKIRNCRKNHRRRKMLKSRETSRSKTPGQIV